MRHPEKLDGLLPLHPGSSLRLWYLQMGHWLQRSVLPIPGAKVLAVLVAKHMRAHCHCCFCPCSLVLLCCHCVFGRCCEGCAVDCHVPPVLLEETLALLFLQIVPAIPNSEVGWEQNCCPLPPAISAHIEGSDGLFLCTAACMVNTSMGQCCPCFCESCARPARNSEGIWRPWSDDWKVARPASGPILGPEKAVLF